MIDDIHSILASAAADVEKAEVPDDLREAAFNAAVALRTSGATADWATPDAPSPLAGRTAEDWHGRVAASLGVSTADIDEAFDLDEDRMHMTIAPSRLPRQK